MVHIIDEDIMNFALDVIDLSSDIAKKFFRSNYEEQNKSDNTPVTLADKEIEYAIKGKISIRFPDHGIVGEEFGKNNSEADYQWIIDPIDGTTSFIIGRPIFWHIIMFSI